MKKPNIIIVEGIDRVGKTTLINMIAKEFGYSIMHGIPYEGRKRTKEIGAEAGYATLSALKLFKNDYVIIDRFHLSELVYGLVDRGYCNNEMHNIDAMLSELNSLLICVRPTNIKKSSEKHGSDLSHHKLLFDFYFENSKMNKICTNFEELDSTIGLLREAFSKEGAK